MEIDYLKRYLDYSGAFYELFGMVSVIFESSSDDDVRRIYNKFLDFKEFFDGKYLDEV